MFAGKLWNEQRTTVDRCDMTHEHFRLTDNEECFNSIVTQGEEASFPCVV